MKMLSLLCLWFLFVPALHAEEPNARAERIARAQPKIGANLRELRREALRIQNRTWREIATRILDRPQFTVLAGRRAQEKAIVQALQADGLWDEKTAGPALFPTNEPMPFLAAPGGPWSGHHAYPGGLVYHTLFNLKTGIAMAANYKLVYGRAADLDLVRASAIWHDSAKTFTLPWRDDGSLNAGETSIAGTSAHHVWAIAEALYRKLSPTFVIVLASAHEAPAPTTSRAQLLKWLKAGARIAGVPLEAAGLKADGSDLAEAAPLEAFIHHFDDGDYPLTIESFQQAARELDKQFPSSDYWLRNEKLAATGDVALFPAK